MTAQLTLKRKRLPMLGVALMLATTVILVGRAGRPEFNAKAQGGRAAITSTVPSRPGVSAPTAGVPGVTVPEGFGVSVFASGLERPVDMALLPSGDLLVAQKGLAPVVKEDSRSDLRLVIAGNVENEPVLSLSTNTEGDAGMLAAVADPAFATNNVFYLWYTTGIHALGWAGESRVRLSRFALNPATGQADVAAERVILEDSETRWERMHHGNGLLFDGAGNLLISIGERTQGIRAQDLTILPGKVLRIRPDETGYTIPADNPFLANPDARPEIYALGLRNPNAITRRAADGLTAVGDVGVATWEEVDILQPGANYGHPDREGPCPQHETMPCPAAPPEYTDPLFYYQHDEELPNGQSGAITGLAFYNGTAFPPEYRGKLFFGDFGQDFIGVGDPATGLFETFAEGLDALVDMEYGDNGLYVLEYFNGRILFIYDENEPNAPPTARLSAAPLAGAAPLSVEFSAASSSDPDDRALKYLWDFGDGDSAESSLPVASHGYTSDGTYTAQLQVKDVRGGSSAPQAQDITVYSGEFPEIELAIVSAPGRQRFRGGDTIAYAAQRGNLDGLDPVTPYTWRIDREQGEAIETIASGIEASSGTLAVPVDAPSGATDLRYRFHLTMRTQSGQPVTVSREILPQLVDITLAATPGHAFVSFSGDQFLTPVVRPAIVGMEYELVASEVVVHDQGIWRFERWQDEAAGQAAITISPPATATTYLAQYTFEGPARLTWLAALPRSSGP